METQFQYVIASETKRSSREAGNCGEERLDRHAAAPLAMTTKSSMLWRKCTAYSPGKGSGALALIVRRAKFDLISPTMGSVSNLPESRRS